MENVLFIDKTNSTNALLRQMLREQNLPEGFVLHTDFQETGKGQGTNKWESEAGKNLLFSMLLYPHQIAIDEQFIMSQLVSIAIKTVLDKYTENITIKWPNDIYWQDKKLAGILIESTLQATQLKNMVIGVGLNVNQQCFESDAPNPISLFQIIGIEQDRNELLNSICNKIIELYQQLDAEQIQKVYATMLYRKAGLHSFESEGQIFLAGIYNVYSDGRLELKTETGVLRRFYFKEVQFVI